MKLFISRPKTGVDATAEYDIESRKVVVLKGSIVSEDISRSEKFRGTKTIEELREKYVAERRVLSDVEFKSPSTAGNFVTGNSTNGLTAWKTENDITLKEYLETIE